MSTNEPAAKPKIDLRSEVVTRPTDEMWDAMRSADAGWASLDRDPYVAELEERMAELSGQQEAFYIATGALGNLLGVVGLAQRGSQVVMERRCHIYWAEGNMVGYVANVVPLLLDGGRLGKVSPEQLMSKVDAAHGLGQQPCLVCLENTHNVAGGCTLSADETRAIVEVAKASGLKIFVDGARLWNAAAYHGTTLADLLRGVDAAMINLNKGLGAPFGAVLVGNSNFVKGARANIKRLGSSGMHRMGYFAAAALVALDTMRERFGDDQVRARALAEGLNSIDGLDVDIESVQTNLVRVEVSAPSLDGRAYVESLRERGIGARVVEPPNAVKFNLHWEIGDDDIADVIDASEEIMATP